MKGARQPATRVLTLSELQNQLAPRRARGERLVFSNGCFDLLHRGHVRYLWAAAELADLLVVGLNSDASVRQLKGPGRPLVGQDERAEVLAALACVDYVTIFDALTAESLVEALRPDVYVKGGDYAERPPPEAALAQALGAQFRLIDLVPGSSTTALAERIQAQIKPQALNAEPPRIEPLLTRRLAAEGPSRGTLCTRFLGSAPSDTCQGELPMLPGLSHPEHGDDTALQPPEDTPPPRREEPAVAPARTRLPVEVIDDALDLIEGLEEIIISAKGLPLSRWVLIDADLTLDLLEQLRQALPRELGAARQVLAERTNILNDCHQQAARMIERAEREIETLLDREHVTRRARIQAHRIVDRADQTADLRRQEADQYAREVLTNLQQRIQRVDGAVTSALADLRGPARSADRPPAPSPNGSAPTRPAD